jgi:hypothetical protein
MDVSRMKKHTGTLVNTGVRCIVVFRKIPGDEENCLVVETDRLNDMYHNSLMEYVASPESQKTNEFSEILNRRTFPDGLNALQALHYKGMLRKTPVSNVNLLPFPGQVLPLALLNAQIDGTVDQYNDKAKATKDAEVAEQRRINPMSDPTNPEAIAQGLLLQAELLEAEAKSKRNEAYTMAPHLLAKAQPVEKKRGRTPLTPEEKARSLEDRKVKRLERDRQKAAEKKVADKTAALKKKVDDKIQRDAARAEKADA